ncbi:unnamed protein product, partial [Ixodes persulcatus]
MPEVDQSERHPERRAYLKTLQIERRGLPRPPDSLPRKHATLLRRAQTHSLANDFILHRIQAAPNTPHYQVCCSIPTLTHTYWRCPRASTPQRRSLPPDKHMGGLGRLSGQNDLLMDHLPSPPTHYPGGSTLEF